MRHVINPDGSYELVDTIEPDQREVPARPTPQHAWRDGAWVVDAALALAEVHRLRAAEYPPVGDVLDEILKVLAIPTGSGLEAIQARRLAVKARFPKPGG